MPELEAHRTPQRQVLVEHFTERAHERAPGQGWATLTNASKSTLA